MTSGQTAGEPAGLTLSSANANASVSDQPLSISRAQRHLLVAGLICYGFDALGFSQTGLLGAYFPELYPTEVRSLGTGFCFNVGRGLAAIAPYTFGQLATYVGLAPTIALFGLAYLSAALLMLLLPEHPPHMDGPEAAA